MAFEERNAELIGSLLAGADLRTKQYYTCKLSSGKLVLAGAGESSLGINQTKPNTDEACLLAIGGISKAVAGAAFAVDKPLTPDANGKLIEATTGDFVLALACEAAAADGDIVSVVIIHLDVSA